MTDNYRSSLRVQFINIGIQYYILGRLSGNLGFMPVTGNIFHRGFEMLLKAALLEKYTEDDLSHKFRHKLKDIWKEYKILNTEHDLSEYDGTITKLAKWESIRYAQYGSTGAGMHLEVLKSNMTTASFNPSVPTYKVNLEEADELFHVLFTVSSINLEFFIRNKNVREKYTEGNLHSLL